MKTQVLIEALDLSEAVIDAEARTVRQKIITAGKSKNGRYYSEAVLQKAASLFEGTKCYANHPTRAESKDRPERSILDITGYLTDVRYEEGILKGTRHFVGDAGDKVWKIVEQVVRHNAPVSLIGASINAVGKGAKGKVENEDVLIVESIDAVNSVDDVTSPAAGGGFERLMMSAGDDLALQIVGTMDYQEWIEARPEYTDRLKNEWKQHRQDEKVKAVQAVADQLQTALTEAKAEIDGLKTERDAALTEAFKARRELAIERALQKVVLKASWKESLRIDLNRTPESEWGALIEREISKAKQVNARPTIAVSGAGQQVYEARIPMPPPSPASIAPRDDEDAESWARRVQQERKSWQ